jgi:hypothetical protein
VLLCWRFPLEEASEHYFLSIKVLFWCCGFIYCVVPLLFSTIFLFLAIIIDLVPYNDTPANRGETCAYRKEDDENTTRKGSKSINILVNIQETCTYIAKYFK